MTKCNNPDCNDLVSKGRKKYCSRKCGYHVYYLKNKERYLEWARKWHLNNDRKQKASHKKSSTKWRKENKDEFNKLVMKNYYRNPEKWQSRTVTTRILNGMGNYKKYNPLRKMCKKCGSNKNLEIHHQTYPTKTKEIKKAIDDGKIYYVCLKCHGRRNHHIKVN